MKEKNFFKFIVSFFFYIIIGSSLLFFMSNDLNQSNVHNYILIILVFFISGGVFLYVFLKYNIYVFEPILVVTIIYFFMFIITPIINLNGNNTQFFGMSTSEGVIKATSIVIVSYLSFILGYYRKKNNHFLKKEQKYIEMTSFGKRKILFVSIILWGIGFISNVIYLIAKGVDVQYVISFGSVGGVNKENIIDNSLGFVSMFGFLMIAAWMYIKEFSNSKVFIALTYLLMISTFFIRGFRFVLVVIILSPVILHYLKKKKSPSLISILSIIVALLLMVAIVGMNRSKVRSGGDFSVQNLNVDIIIESLNDNFEQYKTFYIMVERIPKYYPYSFGVLTFINPLLMLIPRDLWPGKFSLGSESFNYLNKEARVAGSATPNIGEYYMEFGILGCIIFMYIFGLICSKSKVWYLGKKISIHTLIAYSVFVPLLLQFIIRGAFANNFNLLIFVLLPAFINSFIVKKNKWEE